MSSTKSATDHIFGHHNSSDTERDLKELTLIIARLGNRLVWVQLSCSLNENSCFVFVFLMKLNLVKLVERLPSQSITECFTNRVTEQGKPKLKVSLDPFLTAGKVLILFRAFVFVLFLEILQHELW